MENDLEIILGYGFRDPSLLRQAVTHRSLSSKAVGKSSLITNERLEFLGDRVLGLAVANLLFQRFPHDDEGALSKRLLVLVSRQHLALIANRLGLEAHLRLGASEKSSQEPKPALLANMTEAIIGAIYCDDELNQGKAAFGFVEKNWQQDIEEMQIPPNDARSSLQEWCMARKLPLPSYVEIGRQGPDHQPEFTFEVTVKGYRAVQASAQGKKAAMAKAAQIMLEKL